MAEGRQDLQRWIEMVGWFGRSGLHGRRFAMMRQRDFPSTGDWLCLDFPYLAVGITPAGSLVRIWGQVCDH